MCAVPTLVTTPQSGAAMRRERGDFAGVIHAHLNDGDFVLGLKAQQLQRQAESVVEIALRFQDVEFCVERGGDGFFGCGLCRQSR